MKKRITIAIIGQGGREAALVHKYSASPQINKIIAIPGNSLMEINSKVPVKIFPKIKSTARKKIAQICKTHNVKYVDVAQDDAIEAGVTDALEKEGFSVFGPTRIAGQIEWDKAWARNFMKKYKLPIPKYKVFNSEKDGISFIMKASNKKWFIKAAGLAAGKGVIPAMDKNEAIAAIKQMSQFGTSGKTFVIEEKLEGEEFSMFAVADTKSFKIIGSAQDHKRLYNGDQGPNTGGMGANSPVSIVDKKIYAQAKLIIGRALNGLKKEGRPYRGILYLGAIVVKKKVFIIEFNSRWGDPEAEVIIPGIKNDLLEIGMNAIKSTLDNMNIKTDNKFRISISGSMLTKGHGKRRIYGLKHALETKSVTIYNSRVSKSKNGYFASPGRLFHLVASGKNITETRKKAYEAMSSIYIKGNCLHYRTDIGWRDMERLGDDIV
ncbi:MAG: phosphoribosylamine--glycine ligase [Candidatus Levybacteria bacterium CG10_big_fil_rev_8_21_14_0_10_36_7]|nr:MAG: phosphoribosylamine--glycine ligase [Candidatus Levybacteria bacterium CG10_big_fil_rev_8_21_14_0_10_36_7]